MDQFDDDVLAVPSCSFHLRDQISTSVPVPQEFDPQLGINYARQAAAYAVTPQSNFPVGAIAVTDRRIFFRGANFEYSDLVANSLCRAGGNCRRNQLRCQAYLPDLCILSQVLQCDALRRLPPGTL